MILSYIDYKLDNVSVFERVIFRPPFKPSVTYDQEACFIYSISGNGLLFGGIEKEKVLSSESILMKCGSFLNHWNSADKGKECEIIAIHITPDILNIIYENKIPSFLCSNKKVSNKIFQKIPHYSIIDEYIKGLLFYFDHSYLIDENLIILKLKELILLLYNINYKDLREMLHSLFKPSELSFKSIVQTHLFEGLEIKELAALTNTSISTFKRKFKQIFNDTPANYISNQRLEKAARLLKLSDQQITSICFECGFNDLSSFSKAFSKKYLVSPSVYRNTK